MPSHLLLVRATAPTVFAESRLLTILTSVCVWLLFLRHCSLKCFSTYLPEMKISQQATQNYPLSAQSWKLMVQCNISYLKPLLWLRLSTLSCIGHRIRICTCSLPSHLTSICSFKYNIFIRSSRMILLCFHR